MSDVKSVIAPGGAEADRPAVLLPRTSGEMVNTLSHYYRGEMGRMISWRDRIDRTSNWAIATVAAMLSFSLSTPNAHHGVLLFAMVLVLLLHFIEARRYRYYDVYRDRVRIFERHFLAQVLAADGSAAVDWATALADSLRQPRFSVSQLGAMSRRLRRNYVWMYLILLFAWGLKLLSAGLQPDQPVATRRAPFETVFANAALGPVPGWAVILIVALFFAGLAFMALQPDRGEDHQAGEVHM